MPATRAHRGPSIARATTPASASLKTRVMESLEHSESATTRILGQKLGLHQSSVSHTLKELMEEDLVIKKGKSYRLTNIGIIQNNVQKWMGKTLRCLDDHKDFFLSHDLCGIPLGFQATMGVVFEGRETIEKDPAVPFRMNETILPLLSGARNFLVASSTQVPEHQTTVANAVREGGHLQAITSERIMQELRPKNQILKDDSLRSRIELYRYNSINLHLIVTETHLLLSLPRTDGTPDLQNIIINKDPEALEWGRMLYFYFQSGGESVDLTTF